MTVGERIRAVRSSKNLTQKELADKLHINPACIVQWENGYRNPKMSSVMKIAEALDVDYKILLGKKEEYHSIFVWGIFMSHEDRDEMIHDDNFNGQLFATEELAISYLKGKAKWWHDLYNDPCIVDALKQEFFGGKKPDEAIRLFKEPAEILGKEDVWVLTRDYFSSTGAEMRERIVAKELSVKD